MIKILKHHLIFFLLLGTVIPMYGKIPQQYLNHKYRIKIYQTTEAKQYDTALWLTQQYYQQKNITEKEYVDNLAELSFLVHNYQKALDFYQQKLTRTKTDTEQQECRLKIAQSSAALSHDSLTQYYLRQYLLHSPKVREYLLQNDTFFTKIQHQHWWKTLWKEEHYTQQDLIFSELQWLDFRKEYEDLIYYYQSQPDSLINHHNNHFLYAKALYKVGSIQSATHELKQIIQQNTTHTNALQLLFTIKKATQRPKEIITTGHQLLKEAPYFYTPYLDIAQALYTLKKYPESQSYLTFYQQLVPHNDNAKWLQVLLAHHRQEYTIVLEQITTLINKKYNLEQTLLLRAEIYWQTDLPQYAAQDIMDRAAMKPLTDDLILKYVKQFETLQDKKTCCLLLQNAKTNINPDIEFLRKKHYNTKK